jgi:CheY-like chemotaxis protein
MDLQMPEMGGMDATAAIRERERTAGGHLPIIAMTAHAMKGDRERALACGMDEYITKPLDSKHLCDTVERVAAGLIVHPDDESRTALQDAVLSRIGGDVELLADISRIFIENAPKHLDQIRLALDTADAEALQRSAHALKGAAANFNALDLVAVARTFEEMGRAGELVGTESIWNALIVEMQRLLDTLKSFLAPQ